MSFSPAGDRFATATGKAVLVIDARDGTPSLRLDAGTAWSLAFGPHDRLAAAGGDRSVRLWDARSGALLRTSAPHPGRVRQLAFSPDGASLASADITGHILVSWDDGRVVQLEHGGLVSSLTFLADGTLLSAGVGGAALWSLPDGRRQTEYTGHGRSEILAVAVAPDSDWIASVASDGALHVWRPDGSARCSLRAHSGQAVAVTVVDAERAITIGDDRNAYAWDVRRCRRIATFAGHATRPVRARVASQTLATTTVDGAVRLWDLRTLPRPPLDGIGAAATTSIRASADGRTVAAASDAGVVLVDVETRRPRSLPHERPALRLAFSASGRSLATGGTDGHLRTWDVAGGTLTRDVATGGPWVHAVAAHPSRDDTVAIVTGPALLENVSPVGKTGFRLQIWKDGERQLDLARPVVSTIFWGDRLVDSEQNGDLVLLETTRGEEVARWPAYERPAVGLAVAENLLATGGEDAKLFLWTPEGAKTSVGEHDGELTALAIDPQRSVVAAVDSESNVTLWGLRSGGLLARFPFVDASGVAFAPDGRRLWVVADGVLWEIPLPDAPGVSELRELVR